MELLLAAMKKAQRENNDRGLALMVPLMASLTEDLKELTR